MVFLNLWPRITQRLLAVGGAAHSGAVDPLASVFGNAIRAGNLTFLMFRRA